MTQYEEYRYRSADGRLDLFARDYPGQEGLGRMPLLLMHGLTRNSADFEPLVPHLPDYRLIVPDQRGRGRSDWDDNSGNYHVGVYAADMFALMDGLGIDRFGIVGTSMGGLIGMAMGLAAPGRIAALVLNDIGPAIDEEGLDRIRGYVGSAPPARDWEEAAARIAAVNHSAFPDFTQADWIAFARRTCEEGADGVQSAYDPAIAVGMEPGADAVVPDDPWPIWSQLSDTPALVVRGGLSDLLSAQTVARMAAEHKAPFTSVEVPNRGHAPLLDEPEVLAALLPFMHEYAQ